MATLGPVVGPNSPIIFLDNSGQTQMARVAGSLAISTDGGITWTAISGGGFGADTILDLSNANGTPVAAVELASSLPTSTAGNEFAKFLIQLAAAGHQVGISDTGAVTISFEPNTMRVDMGTVQTTWNLMFRQGGADNASIGANNGGQLILTASQAAGGIAFKTGTPGGTALDSSTLALLGNNMGYNARNCAIQTFQGTNVAAASTLVLPPGLPSGGNFWRVTGTTAVNLIRVSNWLQGSFVLIHAINGFTLNHNQAASAPDYPFISSTGANLVLAAGQRIMLVLEATDSGGSYVGWHDFALR